MKYQSGGMGRVVIARFDDGDDVLRGLESLAEKEGIKAGVLYLIGGMRRGNVVAGPKNDELPPVPVWKELKGPHEVVAIGTLFHDEEGPKVHLHGAFGRADDVRVGCLRELSETFLLLEAVVMEITGIEARRELDPASGLKLLRL
ncbi:MAG: DUF296 domain-containing protein [Thermodesulfovibrionales bacterium]|nr:DUF296 domain-containing protein [Thermodesulfovibrionales bacterium]